MYTVYGKVNTRAYRVLWMLEEIGQPYTRVDVGPQGEEIRAISPLGKIPAMVVDDTVLTDSVAIMTYLGDAHDALTYPAGTLDRARQDAYTQRICDEFDALLWTLTRYTRTLPDAHRVPDIAAPIAWEFDRNLSRLGQEFDGPFLMGDKMTIPDILLCHCIGWAKFARIKLQDETMRDYARRLRDRDAYNRVLALVAA